MSDFDSLSASDQVSPSSKAAMLRQRQGGESFLYESHRQRRGEPVVVLVRQSDGFVAQFTPDRIIHLFVKPDGSEDERQLGKRLYDRCMAIYRNTTEERHRAYLGSVGIDASRSLIWDPTDAKQRWCHVCKGLIAPGWHFRCATCNWNVCSKCGSCGEGYVRRPEDHR